MKLGTLPTETFKLSTEFLDNFKGKQPNWGALGYVTFKRTYARPKDNNTTEEYNETIQRVVEGIYTIQLNHYQENLLPWPAEQKNLRAEEMYQAMWDFKFTPPGRGLFAMGTDLIWKRGSAALNNCGFVSTEDIDIDATAPFLFLMDMSMFGVGVGGDVKGAGKVDIKQPVAAVISPQEDIFVVEDTREGWVDAIETLLSAYLVGTAMPTGFDYSKIRPAGTPLVTMGGTAPGPQPLIDAVENITKLLDANIGKPISETVIVDLFNFIGKCVVSGGIRRTAEIMFGEPDSQEYLDLKNPELHQEEIMDRRWASNNSVFAMAGMDYTKTAELTAKNGEPGYVWLENMQAYGRIKDGITWADSRVAGSNPCSEQSLESYELCCLVETFPSKHENNEDYYKTLSLAQEYAKTVTLIPTHNKQTNAVMMRNRRMGVSMSGITQAMTKFGRRAFFHNFCDVGYEVLQETDEFFSEAFCIPKSIKLTSVKPSGTVSLLAGVTPGIHYPQSEYYIRRIRFPKFSKQWEVLQNAGYAVEPSAYGDNSMVVSFPVKEEYFDRAVTEVSMWEQLENTAQMQYYWADNQVSVTINFSEEEAPDIKKALELYETRLKSVSFLPTSTHGYVQAPYEPITKEMYATLKQHEKPYSFNTNTHDTDEKFCDSTGCEIKLN